jgi:hypothetical protein
VHNEALLASSSDVGMIVNQSSEYEYLVNAIEDLWVKILLEIGAGEYLEV